MAGGKAMNNDITQWEYKNLELDSPSDVKGQENTLNQLGKQGWEVTGTIQSHAYTNSILLKRPKKSELDYDYSR